MRSVEVVLMQPKIELLFTFCRVPVGAGVGPFLDRGFDEPFCLAIGLRPVRPCVAVFDAVLAQGLIEEQVSVARSVVGEQALDGDAEASEVVLCHQEEADCGLVCLIGQYGREAEPGAVVDGDVQVLPAGAARPFLHQPGNAEARLADTCQALDVAVNHIAWVVAFITDHRRWGNERGKAAEPGATQNPAYRGPADSYFMRDPPAVPAQTAKSKNLFQ